MDTTPAYPTLRIVSHPLVQHKLSLLRARTTPTKIFKELVDEIATLIAYEATSELPLEAAPEAHADFQAKTDGMVKVVLQPGKDTSTAGREQAATSSA